MIIHHTAVSELFRTAELNCTNTNSTYSRHDLSISHSVSKHWGSLTAVDRSRWRLICPSAVCDAGRNFFHEKGAWQNFIPRARCLASKHYMHVEFRRPPLLRVFLGSPWGIFILCFQTVLNWSLLSAYWFITDPEIVPCNQELASFIQHIGQLYPRTLYACRYSRGHPRRLKQQTCRGASKPFLCFCRAN